MKASHLSFRKRLVLSLFSRYRKNESKIHQLNYILWECTLRCNLSCLHCGSDCRSESDVKDMPAQDFLSALDQIRKDIDPHKTMIALTGGEPLLRKDLAQIGKSLYEREFPWGFVTNGILLNRQRLNELIVSGLRAVTVSLDGLEASHNWLRGGNSYPKVLHAIQMLSTVLDLKFDVVTCATRRNFHELASVKELLIKLGVKKWRIFTIFPIGRAKENEELQLSPKEFKELFDFIKQVRTEDRIHLNYGCEGFLGSYEGEVRDNFFICRAGINIASVLADGSISACPNLRSNFLTLTVFPIFSSRPPLINRDLRACFVEIVL